MELDPSSPEAHYNQARFSACKPGGSKPRPACGKPLVFAPIMPRPTARGQRAARTAAARRSRSKLLLRSALNPNSGQGASSGADSRRARQARKAQACYQRAHALSSQRADELLPRGRVFQESRHLEQAVACLRQALRLQPDSATLRTAMAAVLQESGKLTRRSIDPRMLRLEPSALAHDN